MLSISFDHSDFHCSSVKFVILYSDIAVLARNSMFRSRCCFLFPLMVVDVDFFEFMIWDCFHDRLHTNRCNIPSIFFFLNWFFFSNCSLILVDDFYTWLDDRDVLKRSYSASVSIGSIFEELENHLASDSSQNI